MAEEKKEIETTKSEGKSRNCAFCNKVLKRKYWYYRNGKYYCKKKCWKEEQKKAQKNLKGL